MRSLMWIAGMALGVIAAGCASHSSPPATADATSQTQLNPDSSAAASPSAKPAPPDVANPVDDTFAPPPDAQFTLLCQSFTGPNHIFDAKRVKDELIARTGSKAWYIIHQETESTIYYGYYKTFEDRAQPQEYERAQSDRIKVASLLNENGDPLFRGVIFVPLNLPDPPAPKEWSLAANPGYWTLQIAIYKNSPQRKQYAVDAVKQARALGVEAYYRHDALVSEVFVGSWPRAAVKAQDSNAAVSDDPNEPLLVLPGPIPEADHRDFYTPDGRKMKVVMPKLEILDPSLRKMIAKYPNTWINGELLGENKKMMDGTTKIIPYPSVLISIPGRDDADNPDKPSDSDTQNQQPAGDQGNSPLGGNMGADGLPAH